MPHAGNESDLKARTDQVLRLDGRPLETARDVAAYFQVPLGRLLWTLYKAPDNVRYRHFEIPKRTGGMRAIHAPQGMVRKLQDQLKVDLDRLYSGHPNAHGFITGRSVASNAQDHAGKRWVLNVDLEDFFPTINFGRVRGLFMHPPFGMGPAAATVCAQIVTHRNGLPQGAPTSPVLSNMIAMSLDRALLRLARAQHLAYSRYADDITFSTDGVVFPPDVAVREQASAGHLRTLPGDALARTIAASGFKIHPRKVYLQGRGGRQTVTGLGVNVRVNVARERIRRIRAMLHGWAKFGLEAAAGEHFARYRGRDMTNGPRNPGRAFRNIVYGHLAFVKMVRGAGDPVFLKLCARVIDLDPNPSKFIRQMVFGADDYDIFISHASEDKIEIARPIFEACGRLGLKAFLDEEHIGWGENFTKKINTALGAARTVVVVVSSHSVAKDWPLAEINTALAFEVQGQKKVVAVMVGKPDLTKLPLIKAKNFIAWNGDATNVAAALKRQLRPDPPRPAVPIVKPRMPDMAASASLAVTPPPRKRGLLARLFRRKEPR